MIRTIYKMAVFFSLVMIMTGCGKESMFRDDSGITGQLSLVKLIPEIRTEEQVRAGVNTEDFYIRIVNGTETVREGYFRDMPEIIDLAPDNYTIKVASAYEAADSEWNNPYYEGSQDFTITAGNITEVKTVVCKFANVKVTIIYDDELKAVMDDDCKVNVVVGDKGSLDFGRDETRSGYFAYVPGSSTLVATFTGTVEGVREENCRPYVDVVPGSHYRITYTLHSSNIEVPDPEGEIFPGLVVDATVEREDMTVDVDIPDDILDDDDRPHQGGDNPNPPTPPTPDKQAPELTPADLFAAPQNVGEGSTVKFAASSSADNGFTEFTVIIRSDVLTPSELESVGLTDKLDLVNPGQFEQTLRNFGFPVNVGGMKTAEFDLSQFMGLLAVLGPASHDFVIHVADANGSTDKTLTLVIK